MTPQSGGSGTGRRRTLLGDLTLVDAHALRRRLDRLGPGADGDALADWDRRAGAARLRIESRRAAVPDLEFPPELPVSADRAEIAAAITEHQVVVIAGETGSGKTTQLPKICLQLGRGIRGAIGHTQPRRIAASSVARRLADETHTQIGGAIGYSVRFDDRSGADSLVKVMTDGILLREIATDPMLRGYDTLIVDEAHERSLNIDFILGYLHRLLPRRPDLKLIITSATIEPDRFARHFTTPTSPVPVLEVSGRAHPVEVRYRPLTQPEDPDAGGGADHSDLDQIQGIDAAVTELWGSRGRGDILVFLPTERDIRETEAALAHRARSGAEIVTLFARLSIADQQKVFTPSGGRRIVLATNVAETSLTVPGIRYVIDTGTARISRYSTRTKVQRLPVEPISQASARQRAGRCGRVAPGVCIRLYSEQDFDGRPAFTDPEILRSNLAAVILQMAALRLGGVEDFPFVQAPDRRAVRDGLAELAELGALPPTARDEKTPRLTAVGRTMARLPVDPRIARMLVAAREEGCLDHVLVIAAALSLPDVRERPAERREAADAAHARFAVPGSDFLSYLELWRHLNELRDTLSGNQFRRTCEREFLHYLRVREWRDLHRQLRRVVADLGWQTPRVDLDADAVHRSVLSGLLGNIAARTARGRDYTGARGTTLRIFPGSSVSEKPPPFLMAAEIVETSRLFAHTVAGIDPAWVERLAGDLVKRTYSEPHWSSRRGAAMAYERVTLYGVTLVTQRRVDYGRVDPVAARELFLRHALVEGDWRTGHRFFRHNQALLDSAGDVEDRARRRDVVIGEDALYDFYDRRVGAEVTSTRHFDTWWKRTRATEPHLLDLTEENVTAGDTTVTEADFPGAWQQGDTRLDLRYRFSPGDPDDGVTVVIPQGLLTHVRPAGFDWLVPGLRAELATELIKTLPKRLRRTMAPAQRYAEAALRVLTPRSEPLIVGLARELSTATGQTVRPTEFDVTALPAHLRITFAVTDDSGATVATSKSLAELTRDAGDAPAAPQTRPVYTEWDDGGIGTLPESLTEVIAGQSVTTYPTLDVVGAPERPDGVRVAADTTPERRDAGLAAGVVVLLDRAVTPLSRKAAAGLGPAERLSLSQNPYRRPDDLFADCTRRAIRDVLAARGGVPAVRSPEAFRRLVDEVAPRARDLAPEHLRRVVEALTRVPDLRRAIDEHSGQVAGDDVAEQLAHLIFDGFVLVTPQAHLARLPRYLLAALDRLAGLPGSTDRDHAGMAAIDRVTQRWNERLAQVPSGRRDAVNEQAHWMVEELRVGLFAQRLGTAYPISEKRALRTLDRLC